MFDVIYFLIYIFIQVFTITAITIIISIKKLKMKNIIPFFILIFFIYLALCYFNLTNLLLPATSSLLIVYLFILFKDIYYSILISVFAVLIFALGDALSGLVLVFLFDFSYHNILYNPVVRILTVLIIFAFCLLISKFTNKIINKIYVNNIFKIKPKNLLLLSLSLITAVISVYSYSIVMKNSFESSNKVIIALNLFLIVSFYTLIFLITFSNNENIIKDLEQDYKNKELSQLNEYTDTLESISSDLRNFKHDYINILGIIGEYIQSNDMEELKLFYENELMPESSKILVKDRCFMLLQYIKIPPLKGLISSKIITAQSKQIKTKIEIVEDITELSINLIDICRIIGVLLDNAIEAAEQCEDKYLELFAFKNDQSITFIINNTCNENTPPIYQLYQKNFSTKGSGRGIGLYSVRSIINDKYKNVLLNTKIEHSIFKQELVIINK